MFCYLHAVFYFHLQSGVWCLPLEKRVQHSCTGMYHPPHCCLQDTRHENGKYQLRDLFNDLIEHPSNQSHIIILKTATFKFKIMSERKRKEIERVKEKSSEK